MYRVVASFIDAEKFRFIESVWKPDLLFEFPVSKETSGKQRKFRQEWLVYSKYLDGTFCLPCVCFGMECGKNGAKLDISIPAYILDDGTWKVRRQFERKVRNSQIFCHGNAEFLGCNEKANCPH